MNLSSKAGMHKTHARPAVALHCVFSPALQRDRLRATSQSPRHATEKGDTSRRADLRSSGSLSRSSVDTGILLRNIRSRDSLSEE
jgi:hypothetical protein